MTQRLVAAESSQPPDAGVATRALIVDVDGVVSPVHPEPEKLPWGDEHQVGNVFGPVLTSPTLRRRLDALNHMPDVSCWWLTSWSSEMRASMTTFPGATWPLIAELDPRCELTPSRRDGWWKLTAVENWLEEHPEIRDIAWCDDHLRGGRPAAIRRLLAARGLNPPLLLAPATSTGLSPADLDRLEAWAALTADAPRSEAPAATRAGA